MHYFLWIELEGFYVSLFAGQPGQLIVVRDQTVIDANRLARQSSVRPGMDVKQAKALLADCVAMPWKQEEYVARQKEWLDVCTDFTGTIEPVDQHSAVLDLSNHPNPFDVADKIVRALSSQTRLHVEYGVGPSKWIAQLAVGKGNQAEAIEAPKAFLAPFSVHELLPVLEESRQRLAFLGYRTIGEAAQIPLSVLKGQFGEEALTIRACVQGRHFQPVQPLYPLDAVCDCLIFEAPLELWEMVDQALQELANRLGKRLIELKSQSSKLHLKIELEDGQIVERARKFMKPIRDPMTALIALRLLFSEPLERPIASIRVQFVDLEKTRNRQQELQGLTTARTLQTSVSTMRYVRTVFGDSSVMLAAEVEVPRRILVLREWQNATGWR